MLLKPFFHIECCALCLIIFFTLTGCKGACTKYKRSEYVEGIYHPNGMVQLKGRPVKSEDKIYLLTVAHSFRVSEIGVLTPGWYEESRFGGTRPPFDVARAEVYKKKSYYIELSDLYRTGRFEYEERSATLGEWIRAHPVWSILIGLALLIAFLYVLAVYASRQTRMIVLIAVICVAIVFIIVFWNDVVKFMGSLAAILVFAYIGSLFDSSNADHSSERESGYRQNSRDREKSRKRCTRCRSIDMSTLLVSKGDGRCRDCDGSGHDRTAEAITSFGTLGLVEGKIDCKTCYGTGQCQACGGTGFIYE